MWGVEERRESGQNFFLAFFFALRSIRMGVYRLQISLWQYGEHEYW